MRLSRFAAVFFLLAALALPCARAFATTDDVILDATAIAQLESRAEHAAAKEQCYLYTELVHASTLVAGQQLAAGEMEKASATLRRIQGYADRIHMNLARDTKRLKNAEMLMHTATRRLGECLHHVSSEDKAVVESTLKQLDKVNDELLTQVFAH